MAIDFGFSVFPFGGLFETLLPDFILAFAFFTALIYAVLGRRMGQSRPTVAIAAALGMALAVGLVWWEAAHDLSIRNLGSIAVGVAVIILAGVMYQAIKQTGGGWAGACIALGASILISSILGISFPIDGRVIQSITTVALTVGILAFLLHHKGIMSRGLPFASERDEVRHDMDDLYDDKRTARRLGKGLRSLKKEAGALFEHPERASDVMLQLQRMLPAEGWLTERMARLREKAQRIRVGHIMQIEELQKHIGSLPGEAKRRAGSELAAVYRELKFDSRIERLDHAVAANEKRVRDLTQQAQVLLQNQDHKALVAVLDAARKLQAHNAHLLKTISRSEKRLLQAAEQVAKKGKRGEVPLTAETDPELDATLARMEPPYRSRGEAQLGRVLQRHQIPFLYEPATTLIDSGRYRIWYPDFILPTRQNLILEFAGMMDRPDYAAGILHKRQVYADNHLKAMFIYPQDIDGPDWPGRLIARIAAAAHDKPPHHRVRALYMQLRSTQTLTTDLAR